MEIFLETERLRLRRFTGADLENLVELDSDPAVMLHITGGQIPSRAESAETLATFLDYYRRYPAYGFWAAEEKSTSKFLGWFHFRPAEGDAPDEVELGYRLKRNCWGNGYGVEGSRALIRKGFVELGVRRVHAETLVVHAASRRVMEKSGLRYVRILHQAWPYQIPGDEFGDVEYALTRDEWADQGDIADISAL
ncbi:MAG TPA: GNAT family N-acetyltransferase [Mycobacteriales bacterium]|nr:GNAT family N-acetyltransferase [Mycobacteriales bacterium]